MQIQGDPPGYMQVPLRHHHIHFKVEIEWPVNYPVHTQEYVIFICLQTRLRKICLHFRCLFLKISNPTSKSCVFFVNVVVSCGRSQWPRGLRRMSAAARLLRLCSWWMLSGTVCLTTSTNYMSNNLPRMKNQRLPVQF